MRRHDPDGPRAIVEHAPEALSWHGPSGVFRYISPGFTELLGHEDRELVGSCAVTLSHPDDAERVRAAYRDLVAGRGPFRMTFRMRRADGTYLLVESIARLAPRSPTHDAGVVIATRDVEIHRSLMESLAYEQRIREHLQRLSLERQQFATAFAHRARTPVTSVLGMALTLHRSGDRLDPKDRATLIERLAANAEELAGLIEDATDCDRPSARTGALLLQPCVLADMIAGALEQLAAPDAPIVVDVDPQELVVQASPTDLDRALRALLRNAIAHTQTHTPITIRARRSQAAVVISVEDDGPGIRDELKQTIFEPFVRGDSSLAHDPGLGLGLSLVTDIAADHGGRAWVTDAAGGGAAFHLSLPDLPGQASDT